MTTEHEEIEKLRACPFCGTNRVRRNGNNYQMCLNDNCASLFVNADLWQNAYCWKLLDEKTETIRSQDEKTKELETGIRGMANQIDVLGKRETELMGQVRRLREAIFDLAYNHKDSTTKIWARKLYQETAVFEAESTNQENRESDKTEQKGGI